MEFDIIIRVPLTGRFGDIIAAIKPKGLILSTAKQRK